MIFTNAKKVRLSAFNWVFVISIAVAGVCAIGGTVAQQTKTIPAAEKAKIKGRITQREVDTFTVDQSGVSTVVLLTDSTSVKTNKKGLGLIRRGEEYAVTSLLRGLIVEVEGVKNAKGQLVAEKIRFDEADLKETLTVESRVAPVEESQKQLAGKVDEVGTTAKDAKAVATDAKSEAAKANAGVAATNQRISGLDNFDEKKKATVFFAVNSYAIAPEAKKELDAIAHEALNSTGYILEVTGFADPTGDAQKNIALSQQRADAVVKYLAINGKIPMRRIVTPIGYGATRSSADSKSEEALKQERRVEAKLLINRGITQ
jgi:OmpA-OmpF porin, OOP family